MRIGVAVNELSLNGGQLRFDRAGRVLRSWGHEFCFIALSPSPQRLRKTDLPIIPYEEAVRLQWDAIMLAGGGWRDERIADFVKPNFGTRVQHVLNDQSRREWFKQCNAWLKPHVVIFNNRHWDPGSFTDFQADAFHILEGAVDTALMKPAGERPRNGTFVLGGLIAKNPQPLIDLARGVDDVGLHFFGKMNLKQEWSDVAKTGRLKHAGVLEDAQLRGFYHDVDCVVHTETFAGWANLVAEAMACGVPVVCTRHGTLALAEHERTALVIEEPTAGTIGEAVMRLRRDPALARRLAEAAHAHVQQFSWPAYAERLLSMIRKPERSHYTYAPELGFHGKWPLAQRLSGLEPLLKDCKGRSVLDLGCAEGAVARAFLDAGAGPVHGFDIDAARTDAAERLCDDPRAQFCAGNLSDWPAFVAVHYRTLLPIYDIVLYLGLHQHLKAPERLATLTGAAERAKAWFAVRTPEHVMRADNVRAVLEREGFTLQHEQADLAGMGMGPLFLFRRNGAGLQ